MSIFLEVLKCLLCCEDEHENYQGSYNQIPRQTSFHHNDYEYQTPHRNYSPPLTSTTNQSPAFYNYKPPSPPSQAPKSPFSSSSSSPERPTSSTKPRQSSSPSPNFPTSLAKTQPSSSFNTYSTFPEPPSSSSKLPQSTFVYASSSKPLQSSVNASSFALEYLAFAAKLQLSSSVDQPSALPKPPTSSSKLPQSTLISPSSSSLQLQTPSSRPSPPKLSTSSSKPPQASSKSHSSSPKPPTSSKPSPSSGPPVSSTKLPPIFKQVLSPACPGVINQKVKTNYVWVKKDPLPIFVIPEDIKDLIKNDIVPNVLNQPLSPTTYKDYFAALLYAEEFYHEKWADFNMKNVTLKLHEAAVYKNLEEEEKTFVEFEIDSVPGNRPFLLSRDLVYVRPSGTNVDQFQGIIYRIIRSKLVLVEFEDEFYDYHYSTQKYDVSFSFNRVCLKRAHQAVQTASDALFKNFLFPDCVSRMSIPTAPALLSTHPDKLSAVRRILSIRGSPPYLVAGSTTRGVVSEAVHQLCQTSLENRILICAPSNHCCDGLMRSLLKAVPESDMFRANAAFREIDEVPEDILPSCLYKEPYFSCPPTEELREFRVIFSTYMSSFRLHDKGLTAGHFSHIFLVDASSAIEPETAVALTNFAEKSTTVIVTGQPGDRSRWVRADMAREKGLKISYFERLFKSRPYRSLNPMLITHLDQ